MALVVGTHAAGPLAAQSPRAAVDGPERNRVSGSPGLSHHPSEESAPHEVVRLGPLEDEGESATRLGGAEPLEHPAVDDLHGEADLAGKAEQLGLLLLQSRWLEQALPGARASLRLALDHDLPCDANASAETW